MNARHLVVISGVIGVVLTAHKATPTQTLAAVGVGVGAYSFLRSNRKKKDVKP